MSVDILSTAAPLEKSLQRVSRERERERVSRERESQERVSRESRERISRESESLKRESLKRESLKRESLKRESLKRESLKRETERQRVREKEAPFSLLLRLCFPAAFRRCCWRFRDAEQMGQPKARDRGDQASAAGVPHLTRHSHRNIQ